MMLAMRGMFGGIVGAGAMGIGALKTAKNVAKGGFRAELTIVLCIAMLVVFYKSTHYIANLLGRLIYC